MTSWPILDVTEETQSNTYMPLICSVIDGFEVVFPPRYEELFDASIRKYKQFGFDKLEFENFHGFKVFLQGRVQKKIGGLTRAKFDVACDAPFHMYPHIQSSIIKGVTLEAFFGIFIHELITKMGGRGLRCTLRVHAHSDAAAHRGERWYFINEAGEDQAYLPDDNRKIMNGQKYGFNPIISTGHIIDLNEGVQINPHSKKRRPIVFKGGKTKRRMKRKRTRHK